MFQGRDNFYFLIGSAAGGNPIIDQIRARGSVDHKIIVDASADTPNAHDFWARALCLPLHQNLEPVFGDYVMTQVVGFLGDASRPARARCNRPRF